MEEKVVGEGRFSGKNGVKRVREGMDVLKGYRSESAHTQARKGTEHKNESSKCER